MLICLEVPELSLVLYTINGLIKPQLRYCLVCPKFLSAWMAFSSSF